MRAFALDEFGRPGSVHEVPKPEPGEAQVRVKVEAAAVNPFDNSVLKGLMKDRMPHHFPLIPSSDVAGTIDAVGAGVTEFEPGNRVFGQLGTMGIGHGSMAEYAIASTKTIARRPDFIDAKLGAALPLAAVSALQAVEPMGLERGDVVVILGAAGGIGGFATQMAKAADAIVVGVAKGNNADYVRGLGADEVIDYTSTDVVEAVRKSHPKGIKAVLHASGGADTASALAELVVPGGFVVSMRGGAKADQLQARQITGINVMTQTTTQVLETLVAMVKTGTLKSPAIKTFKLADAGAAFDESAGGHARGKLVVVP